MLREGQTLAAIVLQAPSWLCYSTCTPPVRQRPPVPSIIGRCPHHHHGRPPCRPPANLQPHSQRLEKKKLPSSHHSLLARPSVGAPNEATLPAARSAPSHPSRRRHVRVTGSLLEVRLAHAPGRHDVGRRRSSSSLSAALIHRGRCLTRCRDGHTHTRH